MWNNSRVLITGGTGMVARSIKKSLEDRYELMVATPTRSELNLENKYNVKKFFEEFQPNYVFHLAGKVHGLGGNLLYPIETLSSNIVINDSVLSACTAESVEKVFFAGTVASYEYPIERLPLQEATIFQGEPHSGEYGYAMAKRLAYSYLKLLTDKFSKKFVYGIFTNLYGPHDRFNVVSGHVIPSLVSKLFDAKERGVDLQVWGRPDTTRDFLFVEDAADAALLLMEKSAGIFNIATGCERSMQNVVDALILASDFSGNVIWETNKPIGIARRYSDTKKLEDLGFSTRVDLRDGIAKTWQWYCSQIQENQAIRT